MSAAPVPAPAPWYRPGVGDAVFLAMGLVVLSASRGGTLNDPGLGWHVRNIDAMIAAGGWLTSDPFSGPRQGQLYYTNQWLGDLVLWLGDRWAGTNGIAVVCALCLAFAYRCLFGMLSADGVPWPVALMWTWLAAMGSYIAWLARPNLFTLLFVLLTARLCERYHDERCARRALLWLLPMFAVWANTHGGFVAGLMVLGIAIVVEAAVGVLGMEAAERIAARQRAVTLLAVAAGAGLCTLLNPYGWRVYPWIFQLLGNPFFMNFHFEWQSPDFHEPGAFRFELLVLLFPALLALSRARPNLVGLGLSLAWLHLALNGRRYEPMWVIVVVPTLARASIEIPWLLVRFERLQLSPELRTFLGPARRPAGTGALLGALCLLGWARWGGEFSFIDPGMIPAPALDRLVEMRTAHVDKGEPNEIFHEYNWGGYLTWRGWPGLRVWIDDRNEVQGREHIQEHLELMGAPPDWESSLQRHRIGWVALQRQRQMPELSPLGQQLRKSPHWKVVYQDGDAIIFHRVAPVPGR